MNRQILSIPLDQIEVGERLRAVDADYVALLAASMEERGQDTPITVGPADAAGRHRLIAGAHRTAAACAAKLSHIDAIVSDATGLEAELLEIDENLMRRELSALDRSVFIAKRKEVYEALNPATRHGGKREKSKSTSLSTWSVRFAAATAAKLGVDERTVQRAVARPRMEAMHLAVALSGQANALTLPGVTIGSAGEEFVVAPHEAPQGNGAPAQVAPVQAGSMAA